MNASQINTSRVRGWMIGNVADHIDPYTGEVNATTLAESAADHFDLYSDRSDWTIPDEVFDLAFIVAERAGGDR